MEIKTKIRNRTLLHAVLTIEIFYPEGEEFWVLGIDLISGEANASNGLQTGKTTIPLHSLKEGEADSLEELAVFTVLSFKENLYEQKGSKNQGNDDAH